MKGKQVDKFRYKHEILLDYKFTCYKKYVPTESGTFMIGTSTVYQRSILWRAIK